MRPAISFPTNDQSLEMFSGGRQAENVYTDHSTIPLRGNEMALALVIQDIHLVNRARQEDPAKYGWDIWLRNEYSEDNPSDGRVLKVHALEKLAGDHAPVAGDVLLVRGSFTDKYGTLSWSANTSAASMRYWGTRTRYFSIVSQERFAEEMNGSLEEAAERLREGTGNFWTAAAMKAGSKFGSGVF